MNRKYLIGIIICKLSPGAHGATALKYHDIGNNEIKLTAFLRFAATKPGAQYVNFYYKPENKSEKGRNFAFRRYISE